MLKEEMSEISYALGKENVKHLRKTMKTACDEEDAISLKFVF